MVVNGALSAGVKVLFIFYLEEVALVFQRDLILGDILGATSMKFKIGDYVVIQNCLMNTQDTPCHCVGSVGIIEDMDIAFSRDRHYKVVFLFGKGVDYNYYQACHLRKATKEEERIYRLILNVKNV